MMLEVRDLHAFYGKSHILQGVNLSVGKGEIVSLLGRNGVGRSTTCKAIMGLVEPVGTVRYRGRDIAGLRANLVAKAGIGYVPEDRQVFPTLTVLVQRPSGSRTPVSRSLENWLRHQARAEIERELGVILRRLRQESRRVYVMGQRTKWGNCSALRNLSFNWRLILAPDFVLQYLVTHEAVHLAIPDHSTRFWLTVQSLCPMTERAKQWLSANAHHLTVRLQAICGES